MSKLPEEDSNYKRPEPMFKDEGGPYHRLGGMVTLTQEEWMMCEAMERVAKNWGLDKKKFINRDTGEEICNPFNYKKK